MAAVDTNVLVRFVVDDDESQADAVAALFRRVVASGDVLFVPVTVILEFEWVLRSAFGFDKPDVIDTLRRLLGMTDLEFQSETAVELALDRFEHASAGFADCLHASLTTIAGKEPLWTFDRAAAKLEGVRSLAA